MGGRSSNLVISDQFNSSDSQTCLYSYDDLGRIATANCGPLSNQTFTYDPFGNITKNAMAGTAFVPTYNLSKNQYSSVPSCSPAGGPSYDLNGNPTNDCEHAYAYNSESQPVSIDTANTFVYDALGRMVETVYTGGNTEYIYAPTGEELALANGQTLQKAMIRLPGGGEAVYKLVSGSVAISHYRHADWLGSARFSSTPSQTLYYDVAYAPYGETYAALIGSGGNNSVDFTGQGKDTTTDLYPFLFRQYNSIQSRWVWPDPAGLGAVDQTNPQTWNRYAYAGNTPLTAVDPLGLWSRTYGDSDCIQCNPFYQSPGGSCCGDGPDGGSISLFDWYGNPYDINYNSLFEGENSVNIPLPGVVSLLTDALGITGQDDCEFGPCDTSGGIPGAFGLVPYHGSVGQCLWQGAIDAGLDLTSVSVLPGANQDSWQWSSDKFGFVYTGAGAGESALSPSTAVDAVERTADWIEGSSWAQGEIRQFLRSEGVKWSMKHISKDAALLGKVAGALGKALAAKNAYDRYQECRGY